MSPEATATPGILCCVTSWDSESRKWMSHCLNHDIVECGQTKEESWKNLKAALKIFIEYSYTNDPEGLKIKADPEEWKEFFDALRKAGGTFEQVEEIALDLKPPLVDTSIWIQGVMNQDGSTCTPVQ